MKLTQRRIEDLECPAGRRDMMVFDDEQRGLGVRVTARGGEDLSRAVHARRREAPRPARLVLGVSLAAPGTPAGDPGRRRQGPRPGRRTQRRRAEAKRKAAHEALTLDALARAMGSLAPRRQARALRRGSRARQSAVPSPSTCALPAADLDRAAVVRVLDDLAKDGKAAMASRTAAYGRACYQWAVKRGSLEANPFPTSRLTARRQARARADRRRVAAVWKATAEPGSFNAIVRMLDVDRPAARGSRRHDVGRDLPDDLSTWTIPASRAKNGVAQHRPAVPAGAGDLARRAARRAGEPELVFPGQRGPFNGFSKAKAAPDKDSGVKDWRLHDLRRTMATGLQKLGVRLEVTEAVLNHVAGSRAGIVGVYQRHTWADEKRAALTAWGEHVAAIVEGRETAGNVVPFAREG